MGKRKNFAVSVITFVLTFFIQKFLTHAKILDIRNIIIDLFSWLMIFSVIYFLISKVTARR